MKNLNSIIESFSECGKPWTFSRFVIESLMISETEKDYFLKIYKETSKFDLWNFSDLTVGIENARTFLRLNSNLSEKSINQIVNAIAYQWK